VPTQRDHLRSRAFRALAGVALVVVALSGCARIAPSPVAAPTAGARGHAAARAGGTPAAEGSQGSAAAGSAAGGTASPSAVTARGHARTIAGTVKGDAAATVIDDPTTASVLLVPARPIGALAVFVHGSGQSRESILRNRDDAAVAKELVRHGYLVLSADAGGRAWGDAASVADYERLIDTTVREHEVHVVDLMAESMGGLATMQLAARLPDLGAVTAWYPVCDLRTMQQKPHFAAAITKAWAGAGRRVVSPVAVPPVPLMVWASVHDTVVDASKNAAVCVAEDRAVGGQATWFHTTGDHGDHSNFHPAQVLAFFDAHPDPRTGTRTAVRKSPAVRRS
jgi:pimeloyl-ACP methyl ester carboxylesterase